MLDRCPRAPRFHTASATSSHPRALSPPLATTGREVERTRNEKVPIVRANKAEVLCTHKDSRVAYGPERSEHQTAARSLTFERHCGLLALLADTAEGFTNPAAVTSCWLRLSAPKGYGPRQRTLQ